MPSREEWENERTWKKEMTSQMRADKGGGTQSPKKWWKCQKRRSQVRKEGRMVQSIFFLRYKLNKEGIEAKRVELERAQVRLARFAQESKVMYTNIATMYADDLEWVCRMRQNINAS